MKIDCSPSAYTKQSRSWYLMPQLRTRIDTRTRSAFSSPIGGSNDTSSLSTGDTPPVLALFPRVFAPSSSFRPRFRPRFHSACTARASSANAAFVPPMRLSSSAAIPEDSCRPVEGLSRRQAYSSCSMWPVAPAAPSLSSTSLCFTHLARLHLILCSTSSAFGFSSDEAHAFTLTRPSLRPTASKPVR